jgi:hypothetical protein
MGWFVLSTFVAGMAFAGLSSGLFYYRLARCTLSECGDPSDLLHLD